MDMSKKEAQYDFPLRQTVDDRISSVQRSLNGPAWQYFLTAGRVFLAWFSDDMPVVRITGFRPPRPEPATGNGGPSHKGTNAQGQTRLFCYSATV
jgi:hypothetical protein